MSGADLLTPRQRRLLALVVRDHVRSAQPVASGGLLRQHDLPFSAATIRHDLGLLEDLGFLSQPHTSAGRVPTVAGYRYFVEHLMERAELPLAERETIRHQFHQAGPDLERWLRLSAAVLARSCGLAALVAAEQSVDAPLRRIDLLRTDDGWVQLVGILGNGALRQLRWRPEAAVEQGQLDQLMARINSRLAARASWQEAAVPAPGLEAEVLSALDSLRRFEPRREATQLFHAGLGQVLEQPEFADGSRLRELVGLLEHGQGLEPILGRLPQGGVQVLIGGEPPLEGLPHFSLVLASFGRPPAPVGLLGVVGPTRLAYDRAVPSVGFISGLVTRLMTGVPA